jgi:hypothetical protein
MGAKVKVFFFAANILYEIIAFFATNHKNKRAKIMKIV